ncbi:MAG: DUF4123 domain-containing protein [Isosphaeraceae bacterium]
MPRYSLLDAARDYMRVGMARQLTPDHANLYLGEKGQRLEHVAPHLFSCDPGGMIEHMTLAGLEPDEAGILVESEATFPEVFKHFRRFLTAIRGRDGAKVLFRFYDPRVLRAFLPVCTREELDRFFGPINVFLCQGDEPGVVLTFRRTPSGGLDVSEAPFDEVFERRYGVRPSTVAPFSAPPPVEPPLSPALQRHRQLVIQGFLRGPVQPRTPREPA